MCSLIISFAFKVTICCYEKENVTFVQFDHDNIGAKRQFPFCVKYPSSPTRWPLSTLLALAVGVGDGHGGWYVGHLVGDLGNTLILAILS